MWTNPAKISPPSDDERWRSVEATMRQNGHRPDALIETLHRVQASFGYLNDPALRYVAAALHTPVSQVYGVATFYHLFTLTPPARHTCVVCTGTACHIKGAASILAAAEDALGLKAGETAPDGSVSLQVARCVGSCGPAPLAMFDDETAGYLTPDAALERIGRWTSDDSR
jgi:bidirectional [NiFe] hydrogenase diaphorase subunit